MLLRSLGQGPGYVPLNAIDGDKLPKDAYSEREARQYFEWLGSVAAASGVAVDILAAGVAAPNAALLGPIARLSGGILDLHEGGLHVLHPFRVRDLGWAVTLPC
jgi:hypothetical protein